MAEDGGAIPEPPEYRSALRKRLYQAILEPHGGTDMLAQGVALPLDVITAELGYLMAILIAEHPGLKEPRHRREAIDRLAKGIKQEASRLINDGGEPAERMN